MQPRVGVFGWGIVAPQCPTIAAFTSKLANGQSWLSPFNGFGRDNFLVGMPAFRFADYRDWIDERFPPRRYPQIEDKMDWPALYAVGAFIQSLAQNPGIESVLQELGLQAHVYIGTGLGNIGKLHDASLVLAAAQRRWNRFWADPERNSALRAHVDAGTTVDGGPPDPGTAGVADRDAAQADWDAYWASRSPELARYLSELAQVERVPIIGDIGTGKLRAVRTRDTLRAKLQQKWRAPDPPWMVSADVVWNLHNTPAAEVSMLGRITGLAFAPVAACSTFGVALRLAMLAIRSGDAKAVVIGATDPPPHPLVVGGFFSARVLASGGEVSLPLTAMQGTHVAGGAAVWIVGDYDYMTARGFTPLGMEPVAVGVSSDAHHIITPSAEGPIAAINQALNAAGAVAGDIGTWDLHATATPGDHAEITTLRTIMPPAVLATARKGTFGHGMSAGGGWELTAQYLGYAQGQIFPTPLRRDLVNPSIRSVHELFVLDQGCAFPAGDAGKLSMGIGGINACVISRPWRRGES